LTPGASYRYRLRSRDAANNLSGYSNYAGAVTPTTTQVTFIYTYDELHRLVRAAGSDSSIIEYEYDANGNVVLINRH
jgi:YD repeat-containing protein